MNKCIIFIILGMQGYVFYELYPADVLLAKILVLFGIIGVSALMFDSEDICGPK